MAMTAATTTTTTKTKTLAVPPPVPFMLSGAPLARPELADRYQVCDKALALLQSSSSGQQLAVSICPCDWVRTCPHHIRSDPLRVVARPCCFVAMRVLCLRLNAMPCSRDP